MKTFLLSFISILFLSLSCEGQKKLSVNEMRADFTQLKKELQERNRGLYLFQSEEQFEKRFNRYYEQLDSSKTAIEFYGLLKEFIVPVGERHLSVNGFHNQSEVTRKFQKGDFKVLPLVIRYQNDSTAFIIRNVSKDSTIQLPARIESINGQSIKSIRDTLSNFINKDQGNSTWENWEVSRTFPINYFFHIDTSSTFLVQWVDSLNQSKQTVLNGVTTKFYRNAVRKQSKKILEVNSFEPLFRTDYYPSVETGYLKIGTFSEQTIPDNEEGFITFKEIVKRFFRTVNSEGYERVIIDLRNNTGGKVDYVNFLLSFIVKNERSKKIYYNERERKFWFGLNTNEGFIEPRKKNHFNGTVYLLTNGGTYSASVMVTTFAKDLANAIIVGEEAGGRYNGTSAGRFYVTRLKHSDILVRIPEAVFNYFLQNESIQSISPDIPLQEQPDDYFSYQKDHQLEELLRIIRNQKAENEF